MSFTRMAMCAMPFMGGDDAGAFVSGGRPGSGWANVMRGKATAKRAAAQIAVWRSDDMAVLRGLRSRRKDCRKYSSQLSVLRGQLRKAEGRAWLSPRSS